MSRTADVFEVSIDAQSVQEIALRSRGTPRIANRLLKRVRDFAQVRNNGLIDIEMTTHALNLLQVDQYGLDHIDHKILRAIIERYNGGPVGLDTIAVSIEKNA